MRLPDIGYVVHRQFFEAKVCDEVLSLLEEEDYCVRDVVQKNAKLQGLLLRSPVFEHFEKHRIVRSVLFQKPPAKNWQVPWHQDQFIQVKEKVETPDFDLWSIKEGVRHVRPPVRVMENVISVRIHLTNCGMDDGPLVVTPNSHKDGYREFVGQAEASCQKILCEKGDALIFSPLLFHRSSKNKSQSSRAILHLELSNDQLPGKLEWAAALP